MEMRNGHMTKKELKIILSEVDMLSMLTSALNIIAELRFDIVY